MNNILKLLIGSLLAFVACLFYSTTASAAVHDVTGIASSKDGYWASYSQGGVQALNAPRLGPTAPQNLNQPIVDIESTPSKDGYWLVAADGGVFTYGDARFYGSMGSQPLNKPIVSISSTPSGAGYWMVASDGGIFAFGDAKFYGSMGGKPLNQPVVDIAVTKSGNGYWLTASDGGVFAYGDASFLGSMSGSKLNQPIVTMHATDSGYRFVAADGGIFNYGDAQFLGSTANLNLRQGIIGSFGTTSRYTLLAGDGGIFNFNTRFHGSVTPIPEGVTLAPGDSGTMVKELQLALQERKFWVGNIDGTYGYLTTQAVTAVQKLHRTNRTGVMSPHTLTSLYNSYEVDLRGGNPTRLEVDLERQLLFFIKDHTLLWVINTSTGAPSTPTDRGSWTIYYTVNAWDPGPNGSLYRPRYFNRGEAVHGLESVPPYPASHGCTRVSLPAMDFIWSANLLPVGTQVLVY